MMRIGLGTAVFQRENRLSSTRVGATRAAGFQPTRSTQRSGTTLSINLDLRRRGEQLLPDDRDVRRCLDGDPDLPVPDRRHRDPDISADDDRLVDLPAQDQHP
jgi:hypothetical protein